MHITFDYSKLKRKQSLKTYIFLAILFLFSPLTSITFCIIFNDIIFEGYNMNKHKNA